MSSTPQDRVIRSTRNVLLVLDPERLIAYGRVVTVCFALLAMYLDPTQPSNYRLEVRTLLLGYALFAALLVVRPLRLSVDSPAHFGVHLIDNCVLGLVAFLSDELTSPFFSFLPFTLMAMTIRWGLRGAMGGALILELLLLVIGIPDILDGESELNYLIARSAYFIVFATMLGYFGAYRESSRERLVRLASWPPGNLVRSQEDWLFELCNHAGTVLGSDEMLLAWKDQEHSAGWLGRWTDGKLDLRRATDPLVWTDIEQAGFGILPESGLMQLSDLQLASLRTVMLFEPRARTHAARVSVAAGFQTLRFTGLCAVANPDCRPEDALYLVGIIASHIGAEIERFDLVSQMSEMARIEERGRVARDLHDSVLQDLTATTLKLRSASHAAPDYEPQFREIEALITEQQRRIRRFVEDQRNTPSRHSADPMAELMVLSRQLADKWEVDVKVEGIEEGLRLSQSLILDIAQLVREATANAVRHGRARSIIISLSSSRQGIVLDVKDDGAGMKLDIPEPGSLSLRSRLSTLGGVMELQHTSPGVLVRMRIPHERMA